MKQKNIYVGVYENCQESLFCQIDENTYYDLKTEQEVSFLDLKLDSFVPYQNLFNCKKTISKYLIQIYETDRMEVVTLNRVFLGSIFQITDVTSRVILQQSNDKELTYQKEKIGKTKMIQKNALFYFLEEQEDLEDVTLKEMETGKIFLSNFLFQPGVFYVPRSIPYLKPIQEELSLPETLEKKELLFQYRKYRYYK